jgi:Ribosomal protein L11 methyltransferase (PrmA)
MDFSFPDAKPQEWQSLGSLLKLADYSTSMTRELMGVADSSDEILSNSGRFSLFYLDQLSKIKNPIAVLAVLFLLSGRVASPYLDILDPELLDALWRLQLIEVAPENPELIRATVSIVELRGRYFLSDPLFENLGYDFKVSSLADACMPPHASSIQLLNVLRTPENAPSPSSFLDVGCGSGCQSIAFASDDRVVHGLDPSVRCVSFARINSFVNKFRAEYTVNTWESFEPASPYGHVVFNTTGRLAAFSFINDGLSKLLADGGKAQISLVCEVTAIEGNLASALERRIRDMDQWRISVHEHVGSPFYLSRDNIEMGRAPGGSLLFGSPAQSSSLFHDLNQRGVIQIVNLTLTIQHR